MSDISGLQDNASSEFFLLERGNGMHKNSALVLRMQLPSNTQYGLWPID